MTRVIAPHKKRVYTTAMIAGHIKLDSVAFLYTDTPISYPPFCCTLQELVDNPRMPIPVYPYDLYILLTKDEILYIGKSTLRALGMYKQYRFSFVTQRVREHTRPNEQKIDRFVANNHDLWSSIVVILLSSYSFHSRRSAERDLIRALRPTYNIQHLSRKHLQEQEHRVVYSDMFLLQ